MLGCFMNLLMNWRHYETLYLYSHYSTSHRHWLFPFYGTTKHLQYSKGQGDVLESYEIVIECRKSYGLNSNTATKMCGEVPVFVDAVK